MKIGIDLDDTLSYTMPAIMEFCNDIYKRSLKQENLKTFTSYEIFGGKTIEERAKRIYEFQTSSYGKNMRPFFGAKEILEKLKQNNELFVVTARRENIRKETEKWIEKNFPNIFSGIYFTTHVTPSDAVTSKKKVCDALDMDVMIDDNLQYATECLHPNRKIYLLDYPWNQTDELPNGVIRVKSWKEIADKI